MPLLMATTAFGLQSLIHTISIHVCYIHSHLLLTTFSAGTNNIWHSFPLY